MKPLSQLTVLTLALLTAHASAQVPQTISYQGRITAGAVNFTGTGQFKFALVNATGTTTFWSNDGTSVAGNPPTNSVGLEVTGGLFSVSLANPALAMTAFDQSIFSAPLTLRVWFNDGVRGFQRLDPDAVLSTVPYAFRAAVATSVVDGAIGSAKLANGAITSAKIAPGAVALSQLSFTGAPNVGQVLGFDGANLTWLTAGGGGPGGGSLTLPFSGLAASTGALFSVNNTSATGDAWAIYGHSQTNNGVFGQTHGDAASGVLGRNDGATGVGGAGVFGYSSTGAFGVLAISEQGDGLYAATNGLGKNAIYAQATAKTSVAGRFVNTAVREAGFDPYPTALTAEVTGQGWGLFARSSSGLGVFGQTILGGTGVFGRNESTETAFPAGNAVYGLATGTAVGVRGESAGADGVVGFTTKVAKSGVVGFASDAGSNGVAGINAVGTGVFAQTSSSIATAGFFWNTTGGDALTTSGKTNLFGDTTVHGTATVRVLTINNGVDVAEPFAMRDDAEFPKGSVMVISDERPGELQLSHEEYDTRVAGIISGANGINPGLQLTQKGVNDVGGQPVALTGRVYCRADATFGAIKPGDLLTTSTTPGHARRVNDHTRSQGAVLGKAMSALEDGTGFVLVLVTLQ